MRPIKTKGIMDLIRENAKYLACAAVVALPGCIKDKPVEKPFAQPVVEKQEEEVHEKPALEVAVEEEEEKFTDPNETLIDKAARTGHLEAIDKPAYDREVLDALGVLERHYTNDNYMRRQMKDEIKQLEDLCTLARIGLGRPGAVTEFGQNVIMHGLLYGKDTDVYKAAVAYQKAEELVLARAEVNTQAVIVLNEHLEKCKDKNIYQKVKAYTEINNIVDGLFDNHKEAIKDATEAFKKTKAELKKEMEAKK
jgi:hypothetical protein